MLDIPFKIIIPAHNRFKGFKYGAGTSGIEPERENRILRRLRILHS